MIITSPVEIILPRKTKADKVIKLNLNVYRNLHYRTNNEIKKIYRDMMAGQLARRKFKTPIAIKMQLFKKGRRQVDKNNIYSIIAKFLYDSMVHYECIPDDSDKYIKLEVYKPTKYNNSRDICKIKIYEHG